MGRRIHGKSRTREYIAWHNMKSRCLDERNSKYRYYGGRGIKIHPRWMDFTLFFQDMGVCPPGLELERIDNDGNYEPGNVRWASRKEQLRNTRRSVHITFRGRTQVMADWCRELGVSEEVVSRRLLAGWPPEEALLRSTSSRRGPLVTIRGVTKPRIEWLEAISIASSTFNTRMRMGWGIERAILTPPRRYGAKARK